MVWQACSGVLLKCCWRMQQQQHRCLIVCMHACRTIERFSKNTSVMQILSLEKCYFFIRSFFIFHIINIRISMMLLKSIQVRNGSFWDKVQKFSSLGWVIQPRAMIDLHSYSVHKVFYNLYTYIHRYVDCRICTNMYFGVHGQ